MSTIVDLIIDLVSWAALVAGGAFVFVGGIGALRMPDFYTRLHAAGLTDTMGTILVLLGAALQAGFTLGTLKLAAILVFLLITSPTAAYAVANAARLAGIPPIRKCERSRATRRSSSSHGAFGAHAPADGDS